MHSDPAGVGIHCCQIIIISKGFHSRDGVFRSERINREALCQVSIMYDVGGKLLNGIKSMYVNSLACIRVKGGESECFRIDSGVGHGCITTFVFSMYMDAVLKEVKMGMGRMEMRFLEKGREWRLPGLLCANHLSLHSKLEDLKAMGGCFIKVYRRRGLQVNAVLGSAYIYIYIYIYI